MWYNPTKLLTFIGKLYSIIVNTLFKSKGSKYKIINGVKVI